jgi:RNA polymerase sigma-70 factor (ECF subfamily)
MEGMAGIQSVAIDAAADNSVALNAFLAGVERHSFITARLATRNEDDALDIVQDAMYTFVRSYAGKAPSEWPPLYRRTLQSRIVDWHRRTVVRERFMAILGKGREQESEEEDPLQSLPDPSSPDPYRELFRRDLGKALMGALKGLPVRQRQAFLLRAWEGLDVAETAAAMGCSQGSVKTHYFRACGALRNVLGEYTP